jgi:hypothetical protein
VSTPGNSKAPRYDLLRDFQATPGGAPIDREYLSTSPGVLIAVIRLGRPLTYSRATNRSVGEVVEGAFTRQDAPLLIVDDCISLSVSDSKRSHTKSLTATLKHTGVNYLDRDVMLPGDWVLAWMFNNQDDLERVTELVKQGKAANDFHDGLKFVGRVHSINRDVKVAKNGVKTINYYLSAVGFEELDTGFFYDTALATSANVSSDIRTFMAQIGLDFTKWAEQEQMEAGRIKDNSEKLIVALVDMILGRGVDARVNRPIERGGSDDLKIAPQANKEAPYAYLVPRTVGTLLGMEPAEGSKGGVFGYADIMQTVIGVQQYVPGGAEDGTDFVPVLRDTSTVSRKFCLEKLKGTFLPVNPTFVNVPLWSLLQQYLNPAVNEMFTCLRADEDGDVRPTLVARQIPFSSESVPERFEFQLTRFLSLPRWVMAPVMLMDGGVTVGRSNATRTNMMHIYGEASTYANNRSITNQLVRNPPIFDQVDIQRSGMRAQMRTVNCAIEDQLSAPRAWMEAMADWSFGSQYTLAGPVDSQGIQAPVPVGDNMELEGVVYHIESVDHRFGLDAAGNKYFRSHLSVSNGMPADQSGADEDFPRYAGFSAATGVDDLDELGESSDPGITRESK